jgi:hypothetical protein
MEARLKSILDPLGRGVPRRAVIDPHTGLVIDKVHHPRLKEIDALSEICHIVFRTEPRDPLQVLHRALVLNIGTAWDALRDDTILGITYKIAGDDVGHVIRCLLTQPNETQAYVCSMLVSTNPLEKWSFDFDHVARHIATLDSDTVCQAFQKVTSLMTISTEHLGRLVIEYPHTCRLFLSTPRLADVYSHCPDIVGILCRYAGTLRAAQRYPPLAFLATLCHAGVYVPPDVGIDTMVKLRKTTYDAKIAAAAAVIIQGSSDDTTRAFGNIIESMAAHLQKLSSAIQEKPDLSN